PHVPPRVRGWRAVRPSSGPTTPSDGVYRSKTGGISNQLAHFAHCVLASRASPLVRGGGIFV
ncbi:MAG TPA: hypothetical protein VMU55_03865, partial [Solirubrobacteraceae bacterium]|nr:hypothetical protein [Solirubrobacteraceae bacterium]